MEHRHVEALDGREGLDVARRSGRRGDRRIARAARRPRGAAHAGAASTAARDGRRRRSPRRRVRRRRACIDPVERRAVLEGASPTRPARRRCSGRGRRSTPPTSASAPRSRLEPRAHPGVGELFARGRRRAALAAVLPVAAERRRADLLGLGRLRADLVAHRRGALDDAVLEGSEPLDLDLDDVAGLRRAATSPACPRGSRRRGPA